jgi:signal transduction histidine kinase
VKGRVKDARWGQSFGLAGMQERASLLGGALRIVSSSGNGTTIEADLPC